jgi:hypothetical protein
VSRTLAPTPGGAPWAQERPCRTGVSIVYDDDPQVVSLFLPCTTSIHLAHDVFDGMAEHPIEPLGEHIPLSCYPPCYPYVLAFEPREKSGIAHGDVSTPVELHRCHRATADACVPTIESSLTPAGAAADDPRACPA